MVVWVLASVAMGHSILFFPFSAVESLGELSFVEVYLGFLVFLSF